MQKKSFYKVLHLVNLTKFLPEHTPQYFLHDPTFSQDLIIYQGKQRHLKGDIFHLKAFLYAYLSILLRDHQPHLLFYIHHV